MKTSKLILMELEKITDEYGQLHEEKCDLNNEDGSFDGCDCAMKSLVKEVSDYFLDCRSKALDEQEDNWKDEAKRYSQNADFWRKKYEKQQKEMVERVNGMRKNMPKKGVSREFDFRVFQYNQALDDIIKKIKGL